MGVETVGGQLMPVMVSWRVVLAEIGEIRVKLRVIEVVLYEQGRVVEVVLPFMEYAHVMTGLLDVMDLLLRYCQLIG